MTKRKIKTQVPIVKGVTVGEVDEIKSHHYNNLLSSFRAAPATDSELAARNINSKIKHINRLTRTPAPSAVESGYKDGYRDGLLKGRTDGFLAGLEHADYRLKSRTFIQRLKDLIW